MGKHQKIHGSDVIYLEESSLRYTQQNDLVAGFDTVCPSVDNREIYTMAKCKGIGLSYMDESHELSNNVPGGNYRQH